MMGMRVLAALGLIGACLTAGAQEAEQERDWASFWDDRWYVTGQGGVMFADESDFDTGWAAYLSVGKPLLPYLSIELELGLAELDATGDLAPITPDYERLTYGITGLLYLRRGPNATDVGGFRPFLLASVQGNRIEFADAVTFNRRTSNSYGFQVGGGFTYPLGHRFELISSVRYGIDDFKGEVRDETFYTWTATAGLRLKLGQFPPDSDGDGVPDHVDECPGTPRGVQVDSRGCPVDTDGDGVPDYRDRCPGTPNGVVVDEHGCPLDSDGDGVPDYLDECPNTPPGVQVNSKGCPLDGAAGRSGEAPPCTFGNGPFPPGIPVDEWGCPLDSDGDGVPDYLDECPQTPAGLKVLPNGCALVGDRRLARPGEPADAEGFAVERTQAFILRGVNFEFDKATLTPEAKRILDEVAEVLLAYPDVDVDVEGHTDSIGTAAYNLGLSERRANSVRDYLMQRNVPGRRMTPVGYGLTVPIDTNDTEEGRANNRRVELRVRD